jgi:hypothetical protein
MNDAGRVKIAILCTLGPRSLNGETISALDAYDVDLFRIKSRIPASHRSGAFCDVSRSTSYHNCSTSSAARCP